MVQRAGMDYLENLQLTILDDTETFFSWISGKRVFFFSSKAENVFFEETFQREDIFCFGSESQGFSKDFVEKAHGKGKFLRIPMIEGCRCLNVASSASIVVFEALRQVQFGAKGS